jgi:hypothetical protein
VRLISVAEIASRKSLKVERAYRRCYLYPDADRLRDDTEGKVPVRRAIFECDDRQADKDHERRGMTPQTVKHGTDPCERTKRRDCQFAQCARDPLKTRESLSLSATETAPGSRARLARE